jgi:predicted Kef-type K+ transport protein
MLGISLTEAFTNANTVATNNTNSLEKEKARKDLTTAIAVLVVYIILMLVVGPWLWNNVLRRLVPAVGKAKWYDIVLLAILVGLVAP